MKATVALDDELLELARSYTGLTAPAELIREALTALIERESAKQLALLGGTEPAAAPVRRRRGPLDDPR